MLLISCSSQDLMGIRGIAKESALVLRTISDELKLGQTATGFNHG